MAEEGTPQEQTLGGVEPEPSPGPEAEAEPEAEPEPNQEEPSALEEAGSDEPGVEDELAEAVEEGSIDGEPDSPIES